MMHRVLGADGARDPYTPFVGCCAATVEHYDLDLDYDVEDNGLEARATLTCRALQDTDRIELDLTELAVTDVRFGTGGLGGLLGGRKVRAEHRGSRLVLTLPRRVPAGEAFTLTGAYEGYPESLPRDGSGQVQENAWAFYPVFPLVVRTVSAVTGTGWDLTASAVSLAASLGAVPLVHRLFLRLAPPATALWGVAFVAFSPVAPVLQVPYAESLHLMLLAGALLLVTHDTHFARRWFPRSPPQDGGNERGTSAGGHRPRECDAARRQREERLQRPLRPRHRRVPGFGHAPSHRAWPEPRTRRGPARGPPPARRGRGSGPSGSPSSRGRVPPGGARPRPRPPSRQSFPETTEAPPPTRTAAGTEWLER